MKQSENNEMDNLLRSWAGRQRSPAGQPDGDRGPHLDADELSAYAEDALPVSARARYTSHLVECDDCRKLVAQLAVAAGVVLEEHPGGEKQLAGWRKTLSAFFAPAVLRYAGPALVLVVIGSIFLVTRQSNEKAVSLNSGIQKQQANTAEQDKNDASLVAAKRAPEGKVQPASNETSPAQAKTVDDKKATDAPAAPASAPTDQAKTGKETESPQQPARDQAYVDRSKAVATAGSATAAPPPAKPAGEFAAKDATAKAVAQEQAEEKQKKESEKRDSDKRKDEDKTAKTPTTYSEAENGRQKTRALSGLRTNETPGSEDAETRTIAGRHFAQRNGVWIDTDYRSSMATVNVPRASEQYRALIADEPEIATVARELKGEVFLVWKGHAYHLK